MTTDQLNIALLGAMLILLIGAVAVTFATRIGLPALLAFLGLGLIIGEDGLGIEFDDKNLAQVLGFLALAVILAEGGLSTRWSEIRPALPFALLLSTVGVGISVAVVAVVIRFALGVDWQVAVLIGAIVSSTDAAAVFSILRRFPLHARVRSALEAESGLNDPPVVILVVIVVSGAWADTGLVGSVAMFTYQLIAGALVALVIATLGGWLLRRIAVPEPGLYPAAMFGLPLLAFGAAGALGASGFLAAYVAGLLLCNAQLPHRRHTLNFAHGVAWVAQITLFVMLGLLATPRDLPAAVAPALIIGGALLLLARPASVLVTSAAMISVRPSGADGQTPSSRRRTLQWQLPLREQAFLSWAGLRGAVPIVLATIPQAQGIPGTENLFDIVLVLVVIFTLIQGPTLPAAARWLGVAVEPGGKT
ncbi:potassium/proton antiporter [Hoyosella subflava]|uniref:Sodium/hydrogen exchanger n=1 Tax=Hoyosella subflava (strain DSM 45089 / JCM 17490 / NBRC 109087 / DQS3-9A1) TaxID=443218 RepID=F6EHA8_HOYSD|nr:potassium/proton antiporter [Hoyosella subflava]AEF41087.1 Sodium/hydrogen exchanger [Hoyosella subflava DQS3-9A1]